MLERLMYNCLYNFYNSQFSLIQKYSKSHASIHSNDKKGEQLNNANIAFGIFLVPQKSFHTINSCSKIELL